MSAKEQVDALLAECGATLSRSKKHQIWLLPNGQKFTRSNTPSDRRAEMENLRDLRHALGIVKTETTNGTRRPKRLTAGKDKSIAYARATASPMADALRAAGVAEQVLKDDIEILRDRVSTLEEALLESTQAYERMTVIAEFWANLAGKREQGALNCWLCRFNRWRKRKF